MELGKNSHRIRQRVAAGETADVFVVPPTVMDEFQQQGRIAAESRGLLGRSRMGVVVHARAKTPDLSSTAAFKKALQSGTAVVYEIQNVTTYDAAATTGAPEAARDLARQLTSDSAKKVFAATGIS